MYCHLAASNRSQITRDNKYLSINKVISSKCNIEELISAGERLELWEDSFSTASPSLSTFIANCYKEVFAHTFMAVAFWDAFTREIIDIAVRYFWVLLCTNRHHSLVPYPYTVSCSLPLKFVTILKQFYLNTSIVR